MFNSLSHLNAVTERGQFIVGLLRGMGGNLNFKTRQEFAKEVRIPAFSPSRLKLTMGHQLFGPQNQSKAELNHR